MVSRIIRSIGSFIFWSYERGTWQYDLMVALVLAFVFLTPRSILHDRPQPSPGQVIEVWEARGHGYVIEASVLAGSARSLQRSAQQVLEEFTRKHIDVKEMIPVLDSQGRVCAYTVLIRDDK
jgi:hypothetical protein